jgi:protein-arginine kinase activator protein McsA
VFAEELRDLLPTLHRAPIEHRGRGPQATRTESRDRLLRIQRLRQQLELAVAAEAYERASLLRDEIAKLEFDDAAEGGKP